MDNLTSLPKRWCVIATNDNEAELMMPYANSIDKNGWDIRECKNFYLHVKNDKYVCGNKLIQQSFIELTFEQFERFVLNKQLNTQWLWEI